MTAKVELANVDDLVQKYLTGTSAKQLAEQFGISRPTVGRLLREQGVELRGRSEAERLKWSRLKLDGAAVQRQCGRAWAAARGRKRSEEERLRLAASRSRRVGRFELELVRLLRERGLTVMPQVPVGPYNLDLAVEPAGLAVEVIGSGTGEINRLRLRERTEYILGARWCLVFVPLRTGPQKRDPGLVAIAQELHALAQRLRGDEALRGKYGVIGRHGKPTTFCRRELDGLPRVPGA